MAERYWIGQPTDIRELDRNFVASSEFNSLLTEVRFRRNVDIQGRAPYWRWTGWAAGYAGAVV